MNKVVAIIGPTGSGKSTLAQRIAPGFHAEIVGCDSRQVYRFMDIGTAKPGPEDRAAVPHHLVDIINPDQRLNLADYQHLAYEAIDEILYRDKLPLVVGGTGQYFWSLSEGWEIPRVPPSIELREKLEERAASEGARSLYEELRNVDPEAARKIEPQNVRRVIRALEVFQSRGESFSSLQNYKTPRYNFLIVGLTMERNELYRRVDRRVDFMVNGGLIDEVKELLDRGYGSELPAMSGIGYKQITKYIRGEISLEEAVQRIKFETHRYIRQQYTWFRLKDRRIHWFNIGDSFETGVIDLMDGFIKNTVS